MAQAVQALADPAAPHFHRYTQRARLRMAESGAGRVEGSTLWHHICPQINLTNGGQQSRPCNPGLQLEEIKPQTSD